MNVLIKMALLPLLIIPLGAQAQEQARPVFPQSGNLSISYKYCDGKGEHFANSRICIKNMRGDMENGGLDMIYICHDKNGEPYLDGDNEYLMIVDRISGQTHITMDKMSRTMKIMDLITVGDVSALTLPMTVGESLPDSRIYTTLGVFKVTLEISEKKVLDHKSIKAGSKEYDCWLVHEKVLTKTPFSTNTDVADTWYAEGVGCVKQNIYNTKGKLKRTVELVSLERK